MTAIILHAALLSTVTVGSTSVLIRKQRGEEEIGRRNRTERSPNSSANLAHPVFAHMAG